MTTSAETAAMTFEEAQELSETLWMAFRKEWHEGIGYCKCPTHIGIKYPPNHSGDCPICGSELLHHVGL
jgi:hypothetical protein